MPSRPSCSSRSSVIASSRSWRRRAWVPVAPCPTTSSPRTASSPASPSVRTSWRSTGRSSGSPMPRPDLVIYLEARTDVLVRRIRKRDRDFERGITPEYLERLTQAFRSFFHHYTEAPLLVINCSEIDFVEHGGDLADLIREVRGMKQGVQHYIPLGSS